MFRLNDSLFVCILILIATWAVYLWHKDRKQAKKYKKLQQRQKMWENETRMARKS